MQCLKCDRSQVVVCSVWRNVEAPQMPVQKCEERKEEKVEEEIEKEEEEDQQSETNTKSTSDFIEW